MKALELRKKSSVEITKEITSWREKAATLIRERVMNEQKNVRELRALRKDIARAMTVLNEKKHEEN